jgi:hypothetical protein
MSTRIVFDAQEMILVTGNRARAVRPSTKALVGNLAKQWVKAARKLASGPGTAAAGAYPIPIRTGTFRRGFGSKILEDHAIGFNTSVQARALHEGFKPYGNPHARPIPARPYADDALDQLDLDQAFKDWEGAQA